MARQILINSQLQATSSLISHQSYLSVLTTADESVCLVSSYCIHNQPQWLHRLLTAGCIHTGEDSSSFSLTSTGKGFWPKGQSREEDYKSEEFRAKAYPSYQKGYGRPEANAGNGVQLLVLILKQLAKYGRMVSKAGIEDLKETKRSIE